MRRRAYILIPALCLVVASEAQTGTGTRKVQQKRAADTTIRVANRPAPIRVSAYHHVTSEVSVLARDAGGNRTVRWDTGSGQPSDWSLHPGQKVEVELPQTAVRGLEKPFFRAAYDINLKERVHDTSAMVAGAEQALAEQALAERLDLSIGGRVREGLDVEFRRIVRISGEGVRSETVGLLLRGTYDLVNDANGHRTRLFKLFAGSLELLKVKHALTGKASHSYEVGNNRYYLFKHMTLVVNKAGTAMELWVNPQHDRVWTAGEESGFLAPVVPPPTLEQTIPSKN